MNLIDIAYLRLISQQIAATEFKTVKEMVGWMGAMQAQDYSMAKWAVGARLPNSTDQTIENAINRGEILRTHCLRPTWHLVSAEDIHWILELTAPHIKSSLKSRHRELGLSEEVVLRSNKVIRQALKHDQFLTRNELIAHLNANGIPTDENRASHLLTLAELDAIVCSGAQKGKDQTYALLEERIPITRKFYKEEALGNLARRYFFSHSPASLQDFTWWSGLSSGDAKQALELVKSDFISEQIDAHTYWFVNSHRKAEAQVIRFLPAFDEFIISYRDRSAALPDHSFKKVVSDNGIFRPVIIVNGQVVGIWSKTLKNENVILRTNFFKQPDEAALSEFKKAAARYGDFLGKKIDLTEFH